MADLAEPRIHIGEFRELLRQKGVGEPVIEKVIAALAQADGATEEETSCKA